MVSSYTTNKRIEKPAHNDYINTWEVPVNSDMDVIDAALGATTLLSSVSGSTTLTYAQYQPAFLSISGTPVANVTYVIPSTVGGQWTYDTLGLVATAFSVTVSSGGGGTSVVVSPGTTGILYSDGTNIRRSIPVSTNSPGGSTTQVQYNSSGVFAGSSNLTFNGTTLTAAALTVTAPVGVVSGGTGASTLTANSVLVGNATSAVTGVAPGTSGNLLTSNGTSWASTPPVTPSAYGGVGTYVMAYTTIGPIAAGDSVAGSNLSPAGFAIYAGFVPYGYAPGGSLTGTWRAMGALPDPAAISAIGGVTLFLRIS